MVMGLAHFYVFHRLIRPLALSTRSRKLAWSMAILIFSLLPMMFLNGALDNKGWYHVLQWISYSYMGFFGLVFPFLLFRDLLFLSARAISRLKVSFDGVFDRQVSLQRRTVLLNTSNALVVGFATISGGIGIAQARRLAEVVEVDVPIGELPADLEGYRIVQISDIHVGLTIQRDYIKPIVEKVNSLDADLVAVTGDLVDGYVSQLSDQVAPIGELRGKDGVYFVTGNHEYYWGVEDWIEFVKKLGLTVFNNQHRTILRGNSRLLVAGVTDYNADRILPAHASSPEKALQNAPRSDFKLLLAHQPKSIMAATQHGFDLQISGHTHGGQLFPWTIAVGLVHPYAPGLSRVDRTWLYVSRGTGYWGPPMRIGAPSEITLLRLTRA